MQKSKKKQAKIHIGETYSTYELHIFRFMAEKLSLEQYTNFDTDGDIPESVIEAFVEKIEVSKDCFKWYLRGDFGGDSPIPMNVEGNRKKGATISPQYIIPPANFGDTGCY